MKHPMRLVLLLLCASAFLLVFACEDPEQQDGDGDSDTDGDSDSDGDSDGDGDGDSDSDGDSDADGDSDGDSDADHTEVSASPFDTETSESSGIEVDDGDLVLVPETEDDTGVWIANTGESTVSRFDADSGAEVGRYPSVLLDGSNGAQPLSETCVMETNGNCPSRTAIDFVGNCYVANRGFGHQGTLTKIARNRRDCIDRNGDGIIQTSTDADGDGHISLDDPAEFFAEDECVIWTIDIGGTDERPRALAIAPDGDDPSSSGNVWVGLNAVHTALEVSPDGEIVNTVTLPIQPYGAVAAKYLGLVWFTSAAWQDPTRSDWLEDERYLDNPPAIASVNFRTGEVSDRIEVAPDAACVGAYGIGADPMGRVWVGSEQCAAAYRYDPSDETWMYVDLSWPGAPFGLTRGIVADREGRVWVAHSHCGNADDPDCGLVTSFDAETGGDQVHHWLESEVGSIGVDLDYAGRLWAVNYNTDSASRIDPVTGEIQTFETGFHPYTYSDFTGYSLLTQFPRGFFRDYLEVCEGATWYGAEIDADLPDGAEVNLRLRVADSVAELAEADWIGPWNEFPADLMDTPGPLPAGGVIEFEITLSADGLIYPRVNDLLLSYDCPIT